MKPDNEPFSSDPNQVTLITKIDGIDLRAYFAAAALQGILACPHGVDIEADEAASMALKYADALIEKL